MSTKLNLRIHSVKCVDETNGSFVERFGNDEIYLGGFSIDAHANPRKINPFNVSSDFDDGDIKKYNPPRKFVTFDLGTNFSRPSNFSVGFLLAEKDNGGMNDALQKIYEKLASEIQKKKTQALTTAGSGGTATAIAALPLGLIWSVVKPYVYAYVKEKIIGWFGDDLFPLQDVTISILNANQTWNGSKVSPIAMVEFRGNDGLYQLFYDWELV